jgi:hypothetical protein
VSTCQGPVDCGSYVFAANMSGTSDLSGSETGGCSYVAGGLQLDHLHSRIDAVLLPAPGGFCWDLGWPYITLQSEAINRATPGENDRATPGEKGGYCERFGHSNTDE